MDNVEEVALEHVDPCRQDGVVQRVGVKRIAVLAVPQQARALLAFAHAAEGAGFLRYLGERPPHEPKRCLPFFYER